MMSESVGVTSETETDAEGSIRDCTWPCVCSAISERVWS